MRSPHPPPLRDWCHLEHAGGVPPQWTGFALDDLLAAEYDVGVRRDQERGGVHCDRLSGLVVVHAQRRPNARQGGLSSRHPLVLRVGLAGKIACLLNRKEISWRCPGRLLTTTLGLNTVVTMTVAFV